MKIFKNHHFKTVWAKNRIGDVIDQNRDAVKMHSGLANSAINMLKPLIFDL